MKFKNVSILTLITSLCFSSGLIYASNFSDNTMEISTYEVSIPLQMQPGTILTFDENLNISIIEILDTSRNISYSNNGELLPEDLLDNERNAEDLFIQSMKDEVKHLPVIDLGMDLPDPSPGLTIMYGDDGQITRYYYEDELYSKASTPPTDTLPVGTSLPAGSYIWGTYPNTATITSSSLTAEGRFTVYRPAFKEDDRQNSLKTQTSDNFSMPLYKVYETDLDLSYNKELFSDNVFLRSLMTNNKSLVV